MFSDAFIYSYQKYHLSFDKFQNINLRDQDCDDYVRMLTCMEHISSDDKNNAKTNRNLNATVTFLSKLAEVPGEQITKNETLVGKLEMSYCLYSYI